MDKLKNGARLTPNSRQTQAEGILPCRPYDTGSLALIWSFAEKGPIKNLF